jgi:hypothetical protein
VYDCVLIIFVLACTITHVIDIFGHSDFKARTHIRLMATTVVIMSVRLLKSARTLNRDFGTLVMILYYSIEDTIFWFFLYLVIWLSFSKLFYDLKAKGLKNKYKRLFILDDLRWSEI